VSTPSRSGSSAARIVLAVLLGAIAVAVVAFVAQNRHPVKLTWLVWSFSWPLWLLLIVAIGLSLLAGQLLVFVLRYRRRRYRSTLR
jgi:uncharacterized integral membrane protein